MAPAITHVLFDFDGTLINSVDHCILLVDQVIQEASAGSLSITPEIRGKNFEILKFRNRTQNLIPFPLIEYVPNLVSLDALCALINSTLGLTLDPSTFKRTILSGIPKQPLQLMPGVERLVKHLHKHSIPMAVASGTVGLYYQAAIKHFGDFFPKHFEHAVCAWDDAGVARKKPAPDTYFVAAERFARKPENMAAVLVLEDSITGLEGAIESGAQIVLITKSKAIHLPENAEKVARTSLILDSLEAFRPEAFGLPPYDD